MSAPKVRLRGGVASLRVSERRSRKLRMMRMMVLGRVMMVVMLQRRGLMTLRHHLHHVTHGRRVVGDHPWVVLLEVVAQCLFGSLGGGKNNAY